MRLGAEIVRSLIDALSNSANPRAGAELHLFGSRVDPLKKGGDVDLLLVVSPEERDRILPTLASLRVRLREAAGDQKVDLTVCTLLEREADPFLSSIGETILLKKWS